MNTATLQIASGVWVATARRAALSADPGDIAAVAGSVPWRRRERLAARGVLRALLARVAPDAAQAELIASANGKPALAGFPEIGVSVSHDAGVVAAAVALGRSVGVDVALPRVPPSERMMRRCLRESASGLDGLPVAERAMELAWVWSVQEACVKTDGTGLAGKPWTIDVPVRPRTGSAGSLHWVALRERADDPVSCAFEDI
jgi:4'-phosphopantetheinyl transferase